MPGHDTAVPRRFAEELVVPESHGAAQQLAGRHHKRRVPQQIVESRRDPPGPEGVEQHGIRVGRLVRVILVPQFVPRMIRLEEHVEFAAQRFDLLVGQHAHARQVAVPLVERDLVVRDSPRVTPGLGHDPGNRSLTRWWYFERSSAMGVCSRQMLIEWARRPAEHGGRFAQQVQGRVSARPAADGQGLPCVRW